jgi:uncharacterized membrane protein (DUF4010 family)
MIRTLGPVLAAGFLTGVIVLIYLWHRSPVAGEGPVLDIKNPTELKAAFGFAIVFSIVVFLAAWLSDVAGAKGLYGLALVSGLTDVDAISLSALRLYNMQQQAGPQVAIAVVLAILSNIAFKLALVLTAGGKVLFRRCLLPMAAVATGLLVAVLLI